MLMKNTVQLVQQVHIHRCLIVHNALSTVQKYTAGELVVFFSYELSLMQQQHTGYVFHRTLVFFYFLLQIRRSLRLSVCAFYIRVEALYTLKHHSAESVTSDFFIADPTKDANKACAALAR